MQLWLWTVRPWPQNELDPALSVQLHRQIKVELVNGNSVLGPVGSHVVKFAIFDPIVSNRDHRAVREGQQSDDRGSGRRDRLRRRRWSINVRAISQAIGIGRNIDGAHEVVTMKEKVLRVEWMKVVVRVEISTVAVRQGTRAVTATMRAGSRAPVGRESR